MLLVGSSIVVPVKGVDASRSFLVDESLIEELNFELECFTESVLRIPPLLWSIGKK